MTDLKAHEDMLPEENQNRFCPVFTSYQIANDILNTYRTRLRGQGISFYAEGEGMGKTALSDDDFTQLLDSALTMACEEVERLEEYRSRYVRVRTMCAQKKLFIKVEYTSEHDQNEEDANYKTIEVIITNTGGYLRLQNEREKNELQIAVPTKR